MTKKKEIYFLIFLIFIIVFINYPFLDSAVENFLTDSNFVKIERVIDGDTVIFKGESIRLLGINSPEKGELYSKEAKEFLELLVLNKTVRLEDRGRDRYNRTLAYIFVNSKNINLELVRNGFANIYFPDYKKDIYYSSFKKTWEDCVESNLNFCKKSSDKCALCIELKKFDYKKEIMVFHNQCLFDCSLKEWQIKDEGRKKFIFPEFILQSQKEVSIIVGEGIDNEEILFWTKQKYVWTKSGDTLFLRDTKGELVLFENY